MEVILLVSQNTITSFITGLKEAGIDFIVSLPCTAIKHFLPGIIEDEHFTYVPVSNESDGISICAGASLGGKKPALLVEAPGILVGAYALAKGIRYGGPMLLVGDHRGSFGDGAADFYYGAATPVLRLLDSLDIPYSIVRESDKLKAEIINAQRTIDGFSRPAAILLGMEELWQMK